MSDTRRLLRRHLAALLALTAATVAACFVAYHAVHRNVESVRTETSPAVLEVTAAETALLHAHTAAEESLGLQGDLVGAGVDYRSRIAVASQSLTRAAEAGVAGESGLRHLQTVLALLSSYTGFIELAASAPDTQLREGYLFAAKSVLTDPRGSVIALLEKKVQSEQIKGLEEQTSPAWFVGPAWLAAGLLCLAFTATAAATIRLLRQRFRRRWNIPLLAATVLTLLAPVMLWWITEDTVDTLEHSHRRLTEPAVGSGPQAGGASGVPLSDKDADDITSSIRKASEHVDDVLHDASWAVSLTPWIWVLVPANSTLVLWGLQARVAEYRFQER